MIEPPKKLRSKGNERKITLIVRLHDKGNRVITFSLLIFPKPAKYIAFGRYSSILPDCNIAFSMV